MSGSDTLLYEKYIRDQDYWPLQIIQDEYARALDLPLRIYNLSHAKELWRKFSQDAEFKNRFSQKEEKFRDYVTQIATDTFRNFSQLDEDGEFWKNFFSKTQTYRNCKKRCWLTTLGAGYSLIQSFQQFSRWRLRDFFYYYYQFVVAPSNFSEIPIAEAPYFTGIEQADNLYIAFTPLSLATDQEYLLVAGPVWKPTTILTGSAFEEERVVPLVKSFFKLIPDEKIHKNNFIRMGNNAFPINKRRLDKHIKQILAAITHLLKTQLPREIKLHRCDHVKLAEWSLFVPRICNLLSPQTLNKLPQNATYYHMDHPKDSKEIQTNSPWVQTKFKLTKTELTQIECEYSFELINKESVAANDKHLPLYFDGNFDEEEKNEFYDELMTFLNRLSTRRNARRMELLLVLREWLNDNLNLLTEVHGKEEQKLLSEDELRERYDWLCHWIADRIAANRVILYYYNHGNDTVKVRGIHCSKKQIIETKERQQITDEMKEIAHDKAQRKKFSCYHCIDQLEVKFHRGETPSPYSTPTILEKEKSHSSITAPIMIHGRVWGALEVDGFYPFQFCWDNKKFVQDITNIFSLFFYLNHLLYRLHKLNFTENHNSISEKYQNICHQLAVIFLSHGITLWIPSSGQTKKYECVAWYADKNLNIGSIEQWNSTENNQLISSVAQDKPLFYDKKIGEGHFTDTWRKAQPKDYFEQFKINHVCVIPLYISEKKDELIGCIILYNNSNETFNLWDRRIKFISEYVALSLKAIDSQKRKEEEKKNYIAHEMKQNVTLILEQAITFQQNKKFYFGRYEDIRNKCRSLITQNDIDALTEVERKFDLMTHDFNLHSRELLKQIGWLTGYSELPEDKDISLIQQEYEKPLDLLNFHEEFFNIIYSHHSTTKKKGIYFNYNEEFMLSSGIRLEMHSYNFRQLMKNLIDNAVKYASSHTAIEGILTETRWNVEFSLENLAPCLKEGEEGRIFDEGFRSDYAKKSGMVGQGKGLFIAKQICELYNIDLQYRSQPAKGSDSNVCLHRFILSFPNKMREKLPYGQF